MEQIATEANSEQEAIAILLNELDKVAIKTETILDLILEARKKKQIGKLQTLNVQLLSYNRESDAVRYKLMQLL